MCDGCGTSAYNSRRFGSACESMPQFCFKAIYISISLPILILKRPHYLSSSDVALTGISEIPRYKFVQVIVTVGL